jgi:hypothetical protein
MEQFRLRVMHSRLFPADIMLVCVSSYNIMLAVPLLQLTSAYQFFIALARPIGQYIPMIFLRHCATGFYFLFDVS